jgi:polyisoprenoid-binding protein YceI
MKKLFALLGVTIHVTGRFGEFDFTLVQKGEDFSGSDLSVTIKTASVNTDNEKRDGHLMSDEFFNAQKYPAITFKSTSFEKVSDDRYAITGDLTIRDVTKTVVLDTKYRGTVGTKGKEKAGFKATTTINRFDYGVKWDKTFETGKLVVGEEVEITLLVELARK